MRAKGSLASALVLVPTALALTCVPDVTTTVYEDV